MTARMQLHFIVRTGVHQRSTEDLLVVVLGFAQCVKVCANFRGSFAKFLLCAHLHEFSNGFRFLSASDVLYKVHFTVYRGSVER